MALDLTTITAITGNPVFLGIVFIVFILALKRVTKILVNCAWITVAAVIFPIIANKALGMAVPIDADSIIFFITAGIGSYFLYLFASAVYKALSVAEREAEPVTRFFGGTLGSVKDKIGYTIRKRRDEAKIKKQEKEIRKRDEELKRKQEELEKLEQLERKKEELRLKEIEMKSKKPAKKENFDDYLVIEDPDAPEEPEHEAKNHAKKRKHKEGLIKKFREAEE